MAIDPKEFYDALTSAGLDLFTGVPDSLLKDFCACVSDNAPAGRNVIAANEGNAVGIACGYHIATGKAAVVYMQNSGQGNAVNPLLSIADPDVYSIPMLLVIGWRGEPGVHDEPQHVKQGKVTCGLLEVIETPYTVLDELDWRGQMGALLDTMREGPCPVAAVVRKGLFKPYPFFPDDNGAPLSREQALEAVLDGLYGNDLVVCTTGKTSRELFELREQREQGHSCDFLTVGGMGHTSSIAYGMALGTDADVWCIDGDGSFLMHMGALPVMAQNLPTNFKYILNVNGAHESVGGQPTVAQAIDIPAILYGCGFERVYTASTELEIALGMDALRGEGGRALVITTHQGSRPNLGRPTAAPKENKRAMMEKIASMRRED